jgi:hypothetical protein
MVADREDKGKGSGVEGDERRGGLLNEVGVCPCSIEGALGDVQQRLLIGSLRRKLGRAFGGTVREVVVALFRVGSGRGRCRRAVEELAQSFVDARLSIIKNPKAPSGDRLRAMEQLESRALGRPKETVEHQGEDNPLRAELLKIPQEERRAWLRDLNSRSKAAEH